VFHAIIGVPLPSDAATPLGAVTSYVVVVTIVPLDRVSECLSGQLQLVASQVGYYICGLCYNLLTSCLMKTISDGGIITRCHIQVFTFIQVVTYGASTYKKEIATKLFLFVNSITQQR